jgi:hypothetical protein
MLRHAPPILSSVSGHTRNELHNEIWDKKTGLVFLLVRLFFIWFYFFYFLFGFIFFIFYLVFFFFIFYLVFIFFAIYKGTLVPFTGCKRDEIPLEIPLYIGVNTLPSQVPIGTAFSSDS